MVLDPKSMSWVKRLVLLFPTESDRSSPFSPSTISGHLVFTAGKTLTPVSHMSNEKRLENRSLLLRNAGSHTDEEI